MNNKEVSIVKSAEAFNNYFLNMVDDLQIPISLLKNAYQNEFSQISIIPVTKRQIQGIVCSLKAKDASGYDVVSTQVLKMCNSLISKPLSYICNKSIQTGVFPNHLKYSIVKSLFKNGDWSSIFNYRPVSLLLFFFLNIRKDYLQ